MFQQLMESKPTGTARRGGSLASVTIHAAIIALAVIGTQAKKGGAKATKPEEHTTIYIPAPAEAPRHARPASSPSTSVIREQTPTLVVSAPTITPIGIPEVDIRIHVSGSDPFSGVVSSGIVPLSGGGASGNGIGIPGGVIDAARVDRLPTVRGRVTTPPYPDVLRRGSVEGEVVAQFVIDSVGNIERGSVMIVSSPHALFSDAVRSTLPALRFMPGEVGGRPVRTLVRMPFVFSLH
ncbi:MAG: hypothetical protein JWO05_2595 [Gemmatimonadetes bacterium]|nr:hypothetical protein [Gemmatimonadota bacterium]